MTFTVENTAAYVEKGVVDDFHCGEYSCIVPHQQTTERIRSSSCCSGGGGGSSAECLERCGPFPAFELLF